MNTAQSPDEGHERDASQSHLGGSRFPNRMAQTTTLCPIINFDKSTCATKVIATFGPGPDKANAHETRDARALELIRAGANVIRLNFSHGTHADHLENIRAIRKASKQLNQPVGILADIQGPKTRLGFIPGGTANLPKGDSVTLTFGEGSEDGPWLSTISTKAFNPVDELSVGEQVYLSDASIKLRVTAVGHDGVRAEVEEGGQLRSKVGIAVPDTDLKAPILSAKDISDLKFALDNGADFVAFSFVGKAADVLELRAHMSAHGRVVPIISKIERKKAVENLESIAEVSEGLMVARGDLGVDIPEEEVPAVQERIIKLALESGKPAITATEMLQSMVTNSRPTRAEVADVAGAVRDGSWGVMLSQETAIGQHAEASVRKMSSIARENEDRFDVNEYRNQLLQQAQHMTDRTESLVAANCSPFMLSSADAIIVSSGSGRTSRLVAKYMPDIPVFGVSTTEEGLNRMTLYRGVTPVPIQISHSHEDEMVRVSKLIAKAFFQHYPDILTFRPIVIHGPSQNGSKIHPGVSFLEISRTDVGA